MVYDVCMRIASLSPAVTEALFALKRQDLIVCRDQFSNFPEAAKAIPKLEGHQKIDVTALMEFQPDLVFTSTVIQEKLAAELRSHDLQVVHQDPHVLEDVWQSFLEIGVILDCEKEAKKLVEAMRQGMNAVKQKAHALRSAGSGTRTTEDVRLYIEEWHDPPFASGNWVPEIARAAGGEQFPIERGALSPEVTLEQVQEWDPDMIIVSPCGGGQYIDISILTARPGWDQLRAVQQGNVHVIDDSLLNRPGPRLVDGAQRLYSLIFEFLH